MFDDQITENEIGKTCITHGKTRNAYKVLVGKPEGKRPFERTRCRRAK
jgi:hypothetical protein